jgi:hypothetical protein
MRKRTPKLVIVEEKKLIFPEALDMKLSPAVRSYYQDLEDNLHRLYEQVWLPSRCLQKKL